MFNPLPLTIHPTFKHANRNCSQEIYSSYLSNTRSGAKISFPGWPPISGQGSHPSSPNTAWPKDLPGGQILPPAPQAARLKLSPAKLPLNHPFSAVQQKHLLIPLSQ